MEHSGREGICTCLLFPNPGYFPLEKFTRSLIFHHVPSTFFSLKNCSFHRPVLSTRRFPCLDPCGIALERAVTVDVSSANLSAKSSFRVRISVRNPTFKMSPFGASWVACCNVSEFVGGTFGTVGSSRMNFPRLPGNALRANPGISLSRKAGRQWKFLSPGKQRRFPSQATCTALSRGAQQMKTDQVNNN